MTRNQHTPSPGARVHVETEVVIDGCLDREWRPAVVIGEEHGLIVVRFADGSEEHVHRDEVTTLTAPVVYTCECPLDPGEERQLYRVTSHEGETVICAYCDTCAELAAVDWNGETAAIEVVS